MSYTQSKEEKIRRALVPIIRAAVPDARVEHWWYVTGERMRWGGMLQSDGRINAWMMRGLGATSENEQLLYRPTQLVESFTIELMGFLQFNSGDAGNNSTDEFAAITSAVRSAVNTVPQLGLDFVRGHYGLQTDERISDDFGSLRVHICVASLRVETSTDY